MNCFYSNCRIDCDSSDNIILSNGTIYCRRSGKKVHTFPQFNHYFGGIFLPGYTEIVLNSEIVNKV